MLGCLTCTNAEECTSCDDGSFLFTGEKVSCVKVCPDGTKPSNAVC